MHFVVLVKQVPDTERATGKMDPEKKTLVREGIDSVANAFDVYAIEEALRLKEKLGGKVTAVTMGPPQAEAVLREAISMGVDSGILITDAVLAGSDTWATSYVLAAALKKIGDVSMVLCGKQSSDGVTEQVAPGIAVNAGLPQITYVRKIEEIDETRVVAERMLESGYEVIESPMPCLISVVKEINEPRLPSLKGKMTAKKAVLTIWSAADLGIDTSKVGLDGSPTKVINIYKPEPRAGGEMLAGEPEDMAAALVGKLKDVVLGVV